MNDQLGRLAVIALLAVGPIASSACDSGEGPKPADTVETKPSMIEPNDEDTIPCGPRLVLQTVCQRCHTKPMLNGAPFPLVRRADIVRQTPEGQIRELMIVQIEGGRMPLSPVTIDYDSRETLLDWLHAGAPAEPPHACPSADGGADAPSEDPDGEGAVEQSSVPADDGSPDQ